MKHGSEQGNRTSISIDGIKIDSLRVAELFERVQEFVRGSERKLVAYVNVHTLNLAQDDEQMRRLYEMSSLTYCDGAGVALGAKILGFHLPERMTSASFIYDFCKQWESDGTRIFLLGGKPGVAELAARLLVQKFPGLQIAGAHHGYFKRGHREEEDLLLHIKEASPDILFVGLGSPGQEHWILKHWDRLEARVVWPIGAMVDYISGEVQRAPQWMQDNSLEWLFRFSIEPRRMFRRYMIGNPKFMLRVLGQLVGRN